MPEFTHLIELVPLWLRILPVGLIIFLYFRNKYIEERLKSIDKVPEAERANLIRDLSGTYNIDLTKLAKENYNEVVNKIINQRFHKFIFITIGILICVTVLSIAPILLKRN